MAVKNALKAACILPALDPAMFHASFYRRTDIEVALRDGVLA